MKNKKIKEKKAGDDLTEENGYHPCSKCGTIEHEEEMVTDSRDLDAVDYEWKEVKWQGLCETCFDDLEERKRLRNILLTNIEEKYDAIREMQSVSRLTIGKYPTIYEFRDAIEEGRVSGDYDKRITIVSLNGLSEYTFINKV